MQRSGLYFVHLAIMREADALERAIFNMGKMDDPAPVAKQLAFFDSMLHHHTEGEEQFFFPELEKRAPRFCATYVFDHRDERKHFERLGSALARGDSADARRTMVALHTHLDAHIRKENEIMVPLFEELFTPQEHALFVGKMSASIPPEDMKKMFPWMIRHLGLDERAELLLGMKMGAPPERFAGMLGMLRANLPPDEWTDLERRLAA